MSRRIFLSFLGTGNYDNTRYLVNDETCDEVRFVQQALIQTLHKQDISFDKAYIFCTKKAEDTNWKDREEKKGLDSLLRGLPFPLNYEMKPIENGFSMEEIWEIFEEVYKVIEENDEIYFDITHAFRFMPMLTTVLLDYTQYLKHSTLKAIYYGAFEARDDNDKVAPVFDLSPITELLQYTKVAQNLTELGKISQTISAISKPVLHDGTTELSKQIKDSLSQSLTGLSQLDEYINLNNLKDIKRGSYMQCIKATNRMLNKLKNENRSVVPLINIFGKLQELLKNFVPRESFQNIAAAIRWTRKYNMWQQTFTLSQEYIIFVLADKYKDNNPFSSQKSKEKKLREYIGSILGITDETLLKEHTVSLPKNIDSKKDSDIKKKADLLIDVITRERWFTDMRDNYSKIKEMRNTLNHANGVIGGVSALETKYDELFPKCEKILIENGLVDYTQEACD